MQHLYFNLCSRVCRENNSELLTFPDENKYVQVPESIVIQCKDGLHVQFEVQNWAISNNNVHKRLARVVALSVHLHIHLFDTWACFVRKLDAKTVSRFEDVECFIQCKKGNCQENSKSFLENQKNTHKKQKTNNWLNSCFKSSFQ